MEKYSFYLEITDELSTRLMSNDPFIAIAKSAKDYHLTKNNIHCFLWEGRHFFEKGLMTQMFCKYNLDHFRLVFADFESPYMYFGRLQNDDANHVDIEFSIVKEE